MAGNWLQLFYWYGVIAAIQGYYCQLWQQANRMLYDLVTTLHSRYRPIARC